MRNSNSAAKRNNPIVIVDFRRRQKTPKGAADVDNIFIKDPHGDAAYLRKNYFHKKRGLHFYFRNVKLQMQARFAELIDHSAMPKVFLHGSPHVDNYSRNERGVAMVDFDRSRIGPYAWDLVRLMTSVILRQKNTDTLRIDKDVAATLRAGYVRGFEQPHKQYREMEELTAIPRVTSKSPVRDYVRANERWALQLRTHLLPTDDADANSVLRKYLAGRGEQDLLQTYQVCAIGQAQGSMGRKRYLFYLDTDKKGLDAIFLEIKHVRQDPDNKWYHNPFTHHGERMIAAAELYAPGWETRQGFATHRGIQYWGHQIPVQNVKLKDAMGRKQQKDFMFSVGTQIGRAHRLSLQHKDPNVVLKHLDRHFAAITAAAETMAGEIQDAYRIYMARLIL